MWHDIQVLNFFLGGPGTANLFIIFLSCSCIVLTTWIIQVKKLQQQLQEETDLHLALASAAELSGSPSSESPSKLPDKVSLPVCGFSSFYDLFSIS